jgi:hypothetical protein
MEIIKVNEIEFVGDAEEHYISGVELCRKLGYKNPKDQAAAVWRRNKKDLEENAVAFKLNATDGKLYETRCYNERGALFFITKCHTEKAHEITKKVIDGFLYFRDQQYLEMDQDLSRLTTLERQCKDVKAICSQAEEQADLFGLDKVGKMLWAQNLHHKYNLPCPDNIPLLIEKAPSNLYGKRDIYTMFNAIGRGSKPKQEQIKSIMVEFETDEKYAVKTMFEKNGHTDVYWRYTEAMVDVISNRLHQAPNRR